MSITDQRPGLSAGLTTHATLTPRSSAGLHDALHHPARLFALYGIAGAAVSLVGSLGPWMTVSSVFREMSTSGVAGDGSISLVLAVVAIALGTLVVLGGADDTWVYLVIAAMGLGSTAIALMTLAHINAFGGSTILSAGPGWGVLVTFMASVSVAVLGAAGAMAQRRITHRRS